MRQIFGFNYWAQRDVVSLLPNLKNPRIKVGAFSGDRVEVWGRAFGRWRSEVGGGRQGRRRKQDEGGACGGDRFEVGGKKGRGLRSEVRCQKTDGRA